MIFAIQLIFNFSLEILVCRPLIALLQMHPLVNEAALAVG